MNILAIGDFHGTFPKKIYSIIKKEKIDLVISNGDFCPFHYRELWFKHCFRKNKELWEVIGKDKMKKLILEDLHQGESTIAKLNALSVPVVSVYGNVDHGRRNDQYNVQKIPHGKRWKWEEQDFFHKLIKKYNNIHMVDYSSFNFGNFDFIGALGGTSPGHVKSKSYRKHKNILESLFHKSRKVIFVSHNVPYNTRLDKIGRNAHVKVRGKHFGSKLIRRVIDKCQPILHIGGHIHEGRGKQKIGKTICVNPGSVHEGQGAIIQIEGFKVNKVKFIN